MSKTVLITGASSGMGHEAARILAQQGWTVYAGARRVERMESLRQYGVIPVSLDVTSDESAASAINQIIGKEGRIDALVNNAGYGSLGPMECVSLEEAQRQLDVNLLGVARMTRLVLPQMRVQGKGRIVNVSSIAGKATMPYAGWYNASKYALEAISDATRMETKPFGIKVCLIEPGGVKSDWGQIAADHLREASTSTAYEKNAGRMADLFEFMYGKNPMDLMTSSVKAGKVIARAVSSKCPKTRYAFGLGNRAMRWGHALLPARWFDAIVVTFFSKITLKKQK